MAFGISAFFWPFKTVESLTGSVISDRCDTVMVHSTSKEEDWRIVRAQLRHVPKCNNKD